MDKLRILIGCEESQRVCIAFRNRGFEAYSCDTEPCSGGHPEWHIQGNVMEQLGKGWDLAIFFPPCTYLTVTANRVFMNNPDRWFKRYEAAKFVFDLMNCEIPRIAIENPKGVLSSYIRKPEQYIQPYHYGHEESKMTGLWLKNLPALTPTKIVEPVWITSPSGRRHSPTHWNNPSTNNPENAKLRSKTYPGIAEAMADQWGNYLLNETGAKRAS